MNIALANSILWPALLLVGVPLLLHLYARARPPKYRFGSVELIARVVRNTIRVRKPREWLVLLARTLLFTALVLMFLRPLYFPRSPLASLHSRKHVVLLVDATASMGYVDGVQTRFAAACAEAAEVLGSLSSGDLANVVWMKSRPEGIFPEPGSNLAYLRGELRRAKLAHEAADIEAALKLAVDMLGDTAAEREIHVVSDFQASAWNGVDLAAPRGINLVKIPVGGAAAENGAITDIGVLPASPLVGEEVSIICEVANFSPRPRTRSVYLEVGESRQSMDLMIPAWSRATALFRITFRNPGTHAVTASLDEDSFPGDDRRFAIVEVGQFLRAAMLDSETAEATVWRRVARAIEWLELSVIESMDDLGESSYDLVLLPGWDGVGVDELRGLLNAGGAIFCAPSTGLAVSKLAELAGTQPPANDRPLQWRELPNPVAARTVAMDDEVFKLFADGAYGDPARGSTKARLEIALDDIPGAKLLAAYDDGALALARIRNGGTLYIWNMPLDEQYGEWAAKVEFLPLMAEMALAARPARGGGFERRAPGQNLAWNVGREVLDSDVALIAPDGGQLPLTAERSPAGTTFVSKTAAETGIYTWNFLGRPMYHGVVNFPEIESDLRATAPGTMAAGGAVVAAGGSQIRRLREGLQLWPYLLAAALALLVLEGFAVAWTQAPVPTAKETIQNTGN